MKKYTTIEEQVNYGLEGIGQDEKVEISLKDLMFIYKTFGELNQFFHQPTHYPNIKDLSAFLGDKNRGAYSLIHKSYYQILPKYLPDTIKDSFGGENDLFTNPNPPYYYKPKEEKE